MTMKYQDPVNTVQFKDEYAKNLMKMYENWMDGDTFQGTEMPDLHEAPFDGMDPQSHGAEIEDVTKKKKATKKVNPLGSHETAPQPTVEEEIESAEEYEINGKKVVIEKVKGKGWRYKKVAA